MEKLESRRALTAIGFVEITSMESTQPASPPSVGPHQSSSSIVRTADIDADGLLDVVYASEREKQIVWFKNLGWDNGFSEARGVETPMTEDGIHGLEVADLDSDGLPDLIFGFWPRGSSTDCVAWLRNLGGEFAEPVFFFNRRHKSVSDIPS